MYLKFFITSLTLSLVALFMASTQTFARTCRRKGGICKHANKAGTCDDCRTLCGKKFPDSLSTAKPCAENDVCIIRSPTRNTATTVVCSCCCLDKFMTE
ncbi:hypothetical protein MKX01_014332 [Papaver californicum]|nr:hypothetical protein MKX01_014332 [Papaver californicum]